MPILAAIMLISIQCKKVCTYDYRTVTINLQHPDGQPVLLDSNKVFWKSKNCFLFVEQNGMWNLIRGYGSYIIVDDGMKKELENKKEIMQFIGYLNGEIICERDVLVGADRCHIAYLGKEPLNQVIYDIPDSVRERKFCELVNTEHINEIIPSFNTFANTIDENLPYETKLQLLVGWLLSHSCIIEAQVHSTLGEIAFSFVENEQTINMKLHLMKDNARITCIEWR